MGCQVSVPESVVLEKDDDVGPLLTIPPGLKTSSGSPTTKMGSITTASTRTSFTSTGSSTTIASRANVGSSNSSSSSSNRSGSPTPGQPLPSINPVTGHLMPVEVKKRTSNSIFNQSATLVTGGTNNNGMQLEYAYWTQRGYDPEDPHKENQDEYSICTKFYNNNNNNNTTTSALFAVYDGHGKAGHGCSGFAKKELPKLLTKYTKQQRVKRYKEMLETSSSTTKKLYDPSKWPLLNQYDIEACCQKAYLDCNRAMHDDPKVRDETSGTTATSVLFHGDLLTISSVGDTRAVLGHRVKAAVQKNTMVDTMIRGDSNKEEEKEEEKTEEEEEMSYEPQKSSLWKFRNDPLIAVPLTTPATTTKEDEGSSCSSSSLAATTRRSLGDRCSEMEPEPEVLTRRWTCNDEVLVVASNPVFEFLSNQEVIDICSASESPVVACERIGREAYERRVVMHHHNNRTEDSTVIVCFLKAQEEKRPKTSNDDSGNHVETTDDLVAELVRNNAIVLPNEQQHHDDNGGSPYNNSRDDDNYSYYDDDDRVLDCVVNDINGFASNTPPPSETASAERSAAALLEQISASFIAPGAEDDDNDDFI